MNLQCMTKSYLDWPWSRIYGKPLKIKNFKCIINPRSICKPRRLKDWKPLFAGTDPDGKHISPAVFIPIAEQSRLIHKLWEWTFETTCGQIQEWCQKYGDAIKIGVNLSGRQFEQPDLVEQVKNIIIAEGIHPKYLEIEVTETAVMTNVQVAIDVLEKFREFGIQISIDDFGSGYTSLGYLKKLPIDTLKIDQSFIRDCTDNSNLVIIQGIITISQKMGFRTIAEGVETQEQHDFLQNLECNQFQGYLCSKALPAQEIERLIWPE